MNTTPFWVWPSHSPPRKGGEIFCTAWRMGYTFGLGSFRIFSFYIYSRSFYAPGTLIQLPKLDHSKVYRPSKTRSLVTEKLDAFFANLSGAGAKEGKKAASEGGWSDYVKKFFDSYKKTA